MPDENSQPFEVKVQTVYDGTGSKQFREDLKANEQAAQASAERVKKVNYDAAAADRLSASNAIGQAGPGADQLAALKAKAVEEEKLALLATRRAILEATINGDQTGLAKLRAELAVRQLTIQTLQAEEMEQAGITALLAEQEALIRQSAAAIDAKVAAEAEVLALKQAQIAAEQEQAAASVITGGNLSKARAEAMTLARELGTGAMNTRTLGALLGSLGPLIAPATIAGYVAFEAVSKYLEKGQKAMEAQLKLSKERAHAEEEWQHIASKDDWMRERQKIEGKINDLYFERSGKQGEEREKIEEQIRAQEALFNRLDRVAPGLIERRRLEQEAAKANEEMLADLERMPKSYDLILDKLTRQVDLEQELEKIRLGEEVAQIRRDVRDKKISQEEGARLESAAKARSEEKTNRDAELVARQQIARNQADIEDATNRKLAAEEAYIRAKTASDAADEAAEQNRHQITHSRIADNNMNAAKQEAENNRFLASEGRVPFSQKLQDDYAEAKRLADVERAKVKDQKTLEEDARKRAEDAKVWADRLEKARQEERSVYDKNTAANEKLQAAEEKRLAISKAQAEARQKEAEDEIQQAKKRDDELKQEDHIRAIRNKIEQAKTGAGANPSPIKQAEIAGLEKELIDAESRKAAIRSPQSPAEREAAEIAKQKIDAGQGKSNASIYQSAAELFGAAGGMAGSNFGDIKKAGQAAQSLVGAESVQAMHEQLQAVMELVREVLKRGSSDTKIAESERRTQAKLNELKKLMETHLSTNRQ